MILGVCFRKDEFLVMQVFDYQGLFCRYLAGISLHSDMHEINCHQRRQMAQVMKMLVEIVSCALVI